MGAVMVSLATGLAGAAALVPPLRFLIRKVLPKPGQGDNDSTPQCDVFKIYSLLQVQLPHLGCRLSEVISEDSLLVFSHYMPPPMKTMFTEGLAEF